jgi:hypothetical protein
LRHFEPLPGDAGDDLTIREILAVGVELDLARIQHPVGQDVAVVGADLGDSRPLVQAGLGPVLLHPATAQQRRRDTVEGRSLVQADEGICLEPVTAHAVAAIDHRHPHLSVVDQRIGERHAGGAGTHHEIVNFHAARHGSYRAPRRPMVDRSTVQR